MTLGIAENKKMNKTLKGPSENLQLKLRFLITLTDRQNQSPKSVLELRFCSSG